MPNLYQVTNSELTSIANAIRSNNSSLSSITYNSGFIYGINTIGGGWSQSLDYIEGTMSYVHDSTLSYVGSFGFAGKNNLSEASLTTCTVLETGAFAKCNILTNISLPVCTSIGSYAFSLCTSLFSISFPVCTIVNDYAFCECKSLTTVNLASCVELGMSAFCSCAKLSSISLPKCSIIGDYAFMYCTSMTSISLPLCISIGGSAFVSCYNLLSFYLTGSSLCSLFNRQAFWSTPISDYTPAGYYGSIYVPASLLTSYKTATNWATYSKRFVSI